MKILEPTARYILLTLLLAFGSLANAAVTTTGCGGGSSCSMTQLTAGATITAGSLRFHSFSVLADAGLNPIDEGIITLTGLDDAGLDPGPGFRFNSNGELATASGEDVIYAFTFSVTDVNGDATMKDGSLRAGNNTFGADDLWEVQARVPSTNFLPDLTITDGTFVGSTLFDASLGFAPTGAITVRHNIDIDSFTGGLATGVSLESYTFRISQEEIPPIPVPGAFVLMLTGLGALVTGKFLRSRKS